MILREPEILSVNDHIWLLNDNNEATGYVIAGTRYAAVIDTMIGLVDVRAITEELTDLPLTLINTHGHIDHIGGNWGFEKAFMNLADQAVAEKSLSHPQVEEAIELYNLVFPAFPSVYVQVSRELRFAPPSGHQCVYQWPPSAGSGRVLIDHFPFNHNDVVLRNTL